MSGITRGFFGHHKAERDPRLPPGQYDVGNDFPVLSAELTPRLEADSWAMSVDGLVADPKTWSWTDLHELPESEFRGDIHRVTSWSKLDTSFSGVSVDLLLEAAGPSPEATHVLATSTTGNTTNLPLEHVRGGQAWVVWAHDGKPLTSEHGGPLRLLVPHLLSTVALPVARRWGYCTDRTPLPHRIGGRHRLKRCPSGVRLLGLRVEIKSYVHQSVLGGARTTALAARSALLSPTGRRSLFSAANIQ